MKTRLDFSEKQIYPVGCTDEFDMRTLDFEEFLWAKGYSGKEIGYIKAAFTNKTPLSKSMHDAFPSILYGFSPF